MKVKAYAKLNLSLDVTGKREDGFHILDTVMQTVSLYDEVDLKEMNAPGVRLKSNRVYLPSDDRNTACHAARLFFEACGLESAGVEITLWKHIPSRAGMGGGSADAAAVLRALNEMFSAGLSTEELEKLGAKVGADVPFCVRGGACRCTGVGEKLEAVPPLPDCLLVICKPPAGMSTPRAYALIDQYPLSKNGGTPKLVEALEAGDLRLVAKRLSNRFDETMKLMQVRDVKRLMLSAGALGAMMTGSGSAVYGVFEQKEAAENCMELLKDKGEIFLARPVRGYAGNTRSHKTPVITAVT